MKISLSKIHYLNLVYFEMYQMIYVILNYVQIFASLIHLKNMKNVHIFFYSVKCSLPRNCSFVIYWLTVNKLTHFEHKLFYRFVFLSLSQLKTSTECTWIKINLITQYNEHFKSLICLRNWYYRFDRLIILMLMFVVVVAVVGRRWCAMGPQKHFPKHLMKWN